MPKFIFVTGGVVSGLGKGITTASLGLILKSSGFSVDAVKFDPYLNIDPGTMSPYEHGEVYVLEDGSETDLDLGHYERFLDVNLSQHSSVSSGKIYDSILTQEREGVFLGKNVQLIPNVTDQIKEAFVKNIQNQDPNHVRLIEIGGSTGDMEGEIFLESFRQFKQKNRDNVLHIHLGFVPFLKNSGEFKTKPLQTSIRELLKSGLQPDIIVARYYPERGKELDNRVMSKIALFGNLPSDNVIQLPDVETIYAVPGFLLTKTKIRDHLSNFLGSNVKPILPNFYNKISNKVENLPKICICLVAKYPKLQDAYLSLIESLKIATVANDVELEIDFLDAEKLQSKNPIRQQKGLEKLQSADAIIIPGGFGSRGLEGKLLAAKFARENKKPFLGICLGLQMAVVEFLRSKAGLKAFSEEMLEDNDENKTNSNLVLAIDYIPEQKNIRRKGGTMRLGAYTCEIEKGTLLFDLFKDQSGSRVLDNGNLLIVERHRHRLEVQQNYVRILQENGMKISGKHYFNDNQYLVEMFELDTRDHPYYVGTQSHPEFLSRPDKPHPLFDGLVKASLKK